jgi:large subunit ribosomal protein L6
MSRKARVPVQIPTSVEVKVNKNTVIVKGPKGTLEQVFLDDVEIVVENDGIKVTQNKISKEKQFVGLYWSLVNNMVKGVTEGFEKRLEMIGVGFRAQVKGAVLDIQAGFSHPTEVVIPKGIEVSVEKNTLIIIKGIDKQLVGQYAADVRALRRPEPYKGKGIRYQDEYVRRKAGKAGKK